MRHSMIVLSTGKSSPIWWLNFVDTVSVDWIDMDATWTDKVNDALNEYRLKIDWDEGGYDSIVIQGDEADLSMFLLKFS